MQTENVVRFQPEWFTFYFNQLKTNDLIWVSGSTCKRPEICTGLFDMWNNLRNLIFGGVFSKVLLGVSTVFIIQNLSKPDYALLNNFLFIQSLISGLIFAPFLLASVVQSNIHNLHNPRRLFIAFNIFQVTLVVLLLFISLVIGPDLSVTIFKKADFYHPLLLGLAGSVFLTFQNIILSQHQASESFRKYNIVNILRPFFLIFTLLVFYISGSLNFYTAAIAFLVSFFLSVAGEYEFILSTFRINGYKIRLSQFKWFWRSAQYLILFFFIRGAIDHIATFLVSRYFSIEDFANYSLAFRYYAIVDLVLFSAHIAFISNFTKADVGEGRRRFLQWLKITGAAALLGLVILPFGLPLFNLINGERYADAFPVFMVFMAGMAVYVCFSPVIYGLAQRGQYKTMFGLSMAGLAIQAALSGVALHLHSLEWVVAGAVSARGFMYISSAFIYLRR